MKIDLDTIITWAKMWLLNVPINKMSMLHIGAKNPPYVFDVSTQNIVAVETFKNLGVCITFDLN